MASAAIMSSGNSDWHFVNSNGPKVPTDPAVRRKIRQQAMRDVALSRRQKGNHGRVNTLQPPPLGETAVDDQIEQEVVAGALQDMELSSSERSPSETSSNSDSTGGGVSLELVHQQQSSAGYGQFFVPYDVHGGLCPLTRMPFGPYESLRSRYGVDLTGMGMLTTFNISRATLQTLNSDPWRLFSILGLKKPSYLDYIPTRYGTNRSLTTAVNCVTAKVCSRLIPPNQAFDAIVMRLYSKALKELQEDISDERRCRDPDVLCAVELLSLHELVDASRPTAWEHHVNGFAEIVRHRSPCSFKTDYERSLFLGHVGPIVSRHLRAATPCYLASPEWRSVWRSMIDPDTPYLMERSELTINLRMHISTLPGFFREIADAIMSEDLFNTHRMLELKLKARASTKALMDWDEEYKAYCVTSSFRQANDAELSLRRELFGSSTECLAIQKRVLATVDEDERLNIEVEVQALAKLIRSMQGGLPSHSWLFVGHEINIAHLVTATREEWAESMDGCTQEEKLLATRRRFMNFMNLMLNLNLRL